MICSGCRKANHEPKDCHNIMTCPCHHRNKPREKMYSPETLVQMREQGLIND